MKLIDFEGNWSIERRIEDHLSDTVSHFLGTAQIGGDGYKEIGKMVLANGNEFESSRSYLWSDCDEGIEIRFEDGRPFHIMVPSGQSSAHHWCDPDQYDVEYDFQSKQDWTATWKVKGPRKDYVMISRYRKQS